MCICKDYSCFCTPHVVYKVYPRKPSNTLLRRSKNDGIPPENTTSEIVFPVTDIEKPVTDLEKSETDIKNGPTLSVHSIGPLCLLPRGQRVRLRASCRGMSTFIMVQSSEKQFFSEITCSRIHISLPHPFRPKCIIYSLFFPCFALMSFTFAKIRIREASSKYFPAVAFTNVFRLFGSSFCLVTIIVSFCFPYSKG